MEIKNITRQDDIRDLQDAIEIIKQARGKIKSVLVRNKEIDKYNEMAVQFATTSKDMLLDAAVEIGNAISDIVSSDIEQEYNKDDNL